MKTEDEKIARFCQHLQAEVAGYVPAGGEYLPPEQAFTQICLDRLAEAEPLYRRAQIILEKNLDANHPDIATSLNNLAQVLKKMNRLDEAEPILLRAVQVFLECTRATQQLDPRLQMVINNYGRLLEAMGRSMEQIHTALHEIAPELYRPMNQRT